MPSHPIGVPIAIAGRDPEGADRAGFGDAALDWRRPAQPFRAIPPSAPPPPPLAPSNVMKYGPNVPRPDLGWEHKRTIYTKCQI